MDRDYVRNIYFSLNLFSFPNFMFIPQELVCDRITAIRRVALVDGKRGVHIRANSDKLLDKVVFEFEKENFSREVYQELSSEVLELCDRIKSCSKDESCYVVFFSGSKSIYVYLLLYPIRSNKETLKLVYRRIYEEFGRGLRNLDKNFSNPFHLVRLPNSLHEKTFFRVIPLGRSLPEYDFLWSTRTVPLPQYSRSGDIPEMVLSGVVNERSVTVETLPSLGREIVLLRDLVLSDVVRPCIARSVLTSDPSHIVRTSFVSELMWSGFSEEEVLELIRSFSWRDFDEKITRYHIKMIYSKGLLPPSKTTLRLNGVCYDCGRCVYWFKDGVKS